MNEFKQFSPPPELTTAVNTITKHAYEQRGEEHKNHTLIEVVLTPRPAGDDYDIEFKWQDPS